MEKGKSEIEAVDDLLWNTESWNNIDLKAKITLEQMFKVVKESTKEHNRNVLESFRRGKASR